MRARRTGASRSLALLAMVLAAAVQPALSDPPAHRLPAYPPAGAYPGAPYQPPPRWADPFAWEPPQVEGFDVLYVDDAPLPLAAFVPAGAPLQRHTSRPGAWYTAVFLPMAPGWPVQVWFRQRTRTHELRVVALDASPAGRASVAIAVPLLGGRAAGGASLATAPIALPPASQADGVFLLIELWSPAGERPGPLWLQARSRLQRELERRPWWDARSDGGPPPSPLSPPPPASPLNVPRDAGGVIELPIQRRLPTP
jgi:hypothetical protein